MAKSSSVKAKTLDFTDVKEGGGKFNKKRQPTGDYKAKVLSVEDAPTKETNEDQWLFTIEAGTGSYPYYCKLVPNQLWKIRNLFVAAGLPAPKKKTAVDPNAVVNKNIAVTLEDDEYNGKQQSTIGATFPLSELNEESSSDGDDDEDEAPKAKKAKKSKAPAKDEKPAKKGKKGKKMKDLDIDDM